MTEMDFTARMRSKEEMSLRDRISFVYRLSMPAILAQISEIIMQYIDAAMVGVLGAGASAAIGLVSSSTWLFGGIMRAVASGFSVQVAHAVGAGEYKHARSIFRQALTSAVMFSLGLVLIGIAYGSVLPRWLGADPSIWTDAKNYFIFFCIFIPARIISMVVMNMLQCSGNMKVPSILFSLECVLDVIFNALLIFPTRQVTLAGFSFMMPGAGLGVLGAQLGTSLAVVVITVYGLWYAVTKSSILALHQESGNWKPQKDVVDRAFRIGAPMAMESSALCAAQVLSTKIVAPLGTIAIAANSFAVTAESICYMPGYGIASAATTMVGQAVGARRSDLAKSFAWLTTLIGVLIMTCTGAAMYFICPYVFEFLTPVPEVQRLGAEVLRIELLAEPLFAASIVATGALRGAGDTFIPGILNLVSIWGVRLTLAFVLTKTMGLKGMWIAMAAELCFRGVLFLIRLKRGKWLEKLTEAEKAAA